MTHSAVNTRLQNVGPHVSQRPDSPHYQMIGLAILLRVVSRASRAVGGALCSLRRLLEESFINLHPSSGRKIDQ